MWLTPRLNDFLDLYLDIFDLYILTPLIPLKKGEVSFNDSFFYLFVLGKQLHAPLGPLMLRGLEY